MMADAVRAEIDRDPDHYRPETWSIEPVGYCPCCDRDVFRCTTRHTGWTEGCATHRHVVHPRINVETHAPDPNGSGVGCCCVAPHFGSKHAEIDPPSKVKKPGKKRAKAVTK